MKGKLHIVLVDLSGEITYNKNYILNIFRRLKVYQKDRNAEDTMDNQFNNGDNQFNNGNNQFNNGNNGNNNPNGNGKKSNGSGQML